jgi:hypothetical protein
MDRIWMDSADAPWLRQQRAASVIQALGSPFKPDIDDTLAAEGARPPHDPAHYWNFFAGTD